MILPYKRDFVLLWNLIPFLMLMPYVMTRHGGSPGEPVPRYKSNGWLSVKGMLNVDASVRECYVLLNLRQKVLITPFTFICHQ